MHLPGLEGPVHLAGPGLRAAYPLVGDGEAAAFLDVGRLYDRRDLLALRLRRPARDPDTAITTAGRNQAPIARFRLPCRKTP